MPTATERAERYFEGISQGGSLYDADVGDIPVPVSDPERYTTAGTSDTEGPSFEPSDTEGSDSDGRHIRLARTRRVRFTLPREPRTRDDSRTGDDSRGGVGGQTEVRIILFTVLFNFNRVNGFSTDNFEILSGPSVY